MDVKSLKKVGRGTRIYEPVTILADSKHNVEIGENCSIGQYCFIAARNFRMEDEAELCPQVTVSGGGDVSIGPHATVTFGVRLIPATFTTEGEYLNDNVYAREPKLCEIVRGHIIIGPGAYIGSNAVICVSKRYPVIVIGAHAVIGALSYIDKDVPPNIVHPKQNMWRKDR